MVDIALVNSELGALLPAVSKWLAQQDYEEYEQCMEPPYFSSYLIETSVYCFYLDDACYKYLGYSPYHCSFPAAKTVREFFPPTGVVPRRFHPRF